MSCVVLMLCFFFKQKTAYEMRISDWSSDVCSSDLLALLSRLHQGPHRDLLALGELVFQGGRIGADERDRRLGGLQVQKPVALGEIEELALPMVQPAFW